MIMDAVRRFLEQRNNELLSNLRFRIAKEAKGLQASDSWLDKLKAACYVADERSGFLGVFHCLDVKDDKVGAGNLVDFLHDLAAMAADARHTAERRGRAPWSVHLFSICVLDGVKRETWSKALAAELKKLQISTSVLSTVGMTCLSGTAQEIEKMLADYENRSDTDPQVNQFFAPLLLSLRRSVPDPKVAQLVETRLHDQFLVEIEQLWGSTSLSGAQEVATKEFELLRTLAQSTPESLPPTLPPVQQLTLSKFRRFQAVKLELDHWSVVVGGNGTGKTSILEALEVGLTGQSERIEQGRAAPSALTAIGETADSWGELTLTDNQSLPVQCRPGMAALQGLSAFYLSQEKLSAFARSAHQERERVMLGLFGLDKLATKVLEGLRQRFDQALLSFPDLTPDPEEDARGGYLAASRHRLYRHWEASVAQNAAKLAAAVDAVASARLDSLFAAPVWEDWQRWREAWAALQAQWDNVRAQLNTGPADAAKLSAAVGRFEEESIGLDAKLDGIATTEDQIALMADLLVGDTVTGATERQPYREKVRTLAEAERQYLLHLLEAWTKVEVKHLTKSLSTLVSELDKFNSQYPRLLRLNWLRLVQKRFERWVSRTLADVLKEQNVHAIFLELVGALTTLNWTHLPLEMVGSEIRVKDPVTGQPIQALPSALLNQAEQQIVGLAWFFTAYHFRGSRFTRTLMLDDPFQGFDDANLHSFVRMFNDIVRLLGDRPSGAEKPLGPQVVLATHDYRIAEILRREYAAPDAGAVAKDRITDGERICFVDVRREGNYTSIPAPNYFMRNQVATWDEIFIES